MALLEMNHITKRFHAVLANDDISLQVEKGEIHALLGENGAGKSTLMNILYGMYDNWDGEIFFDGASAPITETRTAIALGIGMVHQHFMLIPALTVIENIVLGLGHGLKQLDLARASESVSEMAARYGIALNLQRKVSELSVGQQQRLEILKALYRKAKLLILDEPTAVLTPNEVAALFDMIKQLTKEGLSVIFISHKLNEIMELCDRCTILRQGKYIETLKIEEIQDKQHLARLMVGHEVSLQTAKPDIPLREEVLRLEQVSCGGGAERNVLSNISFALRGGEILGICGVDGNGQSELVSCIMGLKRIDEGVVKICGSDCTNHSVKDILNHHVAHIPEDRQKFGIVSEMSIEENIVLMRCHHAPLSNHGVFHKKAVEELSRTLCEEFEVKTPSTKELIKNLSGGNQQKLVVARELERTPKLLVAVHPSRGLDIGATKYIQSRMIEEKNRGAGVLLISTELDELLELSDRILVMYEGEVMGILTQKEATRDRIGLMMGGVSTKSAETPS